MSRLRNKLITFIIIIITPMLFINLFTLLLSNKIEMQYSTMISKLITMEEAKRNINNSVLYFDKYITTRAQDDLKNCIINYEKAKQNINALGSGSTIENMYYLRELKNTLESYKKSYDITIEKLNSNMGYNFYDDFIETKNIAHYCNEYIEKINENYLKYNNENYKLLVRKNRIKDSAVILYFLLMIIVCLFITLIFSKNITETLKELVLEVEKVSKGYFNIKKINPSNIYEVDILLKGFNIMVSDIKTLIDEIKEKAEIENMLKETQLKALQSQINPHFLFNTLNSIIQIADIEGAVETEKLMNAVSKLLRYSLSMVDRQASLREELDIIKQYVYIQETRFEDRVAFNIEVNGYIDDIIVPGMTLQPLVENAFIHGIEPKEEGGSIRIKVDRNEKHCLITIEDDGCGMTEETIFSILDDKEGKKHTGHITGIGTKNVIKRLKLLYNDEFAFKIQSKVDEGTKIILKIPITGVS
ncbi:sensor histidine kinase [Clostridium thermopalmarium]|uniref:Sensor histidine kinase YpdA n=1 Tax=Clostridium thermopalmarium DSM 5974 TaxID=1121340 RepID=A0A2T0ANP1_9CLOT|nr:sensor histidine kinase [Clostridium thermopalmarium]PRR70581.1 Sensor histidine kinase YpdA [Clostridium thermopalmarium DSM 5974]PVZ21689.1 sensor histidine kinase YesM [Clostridium thermopalmarium DSM 5974]